MPITLDTLFTYTNIEGERKNAKGYVPGGEIYYQNCIVYLKLEWSSEAIQGSYKGGWDSLK
jgi:hypothetical protein